MNFNHPRSIWTIFRSWPSSVLISVADFWTRVCEKELFPTKFSIINSSLLFMNVKGKNTLLWKKSISQEITLFLKISTLRPGTLHKQLGLVCVLIWVVIHIQGATATCFPSVLHGRKLSIKAPSQEILAPFVPHTSKLFSSRVLPATDGCNQHQTTAIFLHQFTNAQPSFLAHLFPLLSYFVNKVKTRGKNIFKLILCYFEIKSNSFSNITC
jgi:hypothetical protein